MLREEGVSAGRPPEPTTWYADGLRFGCTQCGNCCGGAPGMVWVSPDECAAIAAELKIPVAEFLERHTRMASSGRLSLREKPDGDCELLTRDRHGKARCLIYPVRPVQCRTWPFWPSNLESRAAWKAAARSCPGIGQGQHYALPVIQAAVAANGALPL